MVQSLEKKYLVPLAVLALYLLVSLWRLGDIPPPWYDEISHMNTAWHFAKDGSFWNDLYYHKYGPTLYTNMTLQWILLGTYIKVFGLSVLSARLLYVIMSMATLSGVYLLARRMFNRRIAAYSMCALASCRIFFYNSRQIMPEVPAALFAVMAALFFFMAKENRPSLFYAVSGILSGFAYLSHPTGLGMTFAITALFFYDRIPARYLLLYLVSAFVAVFPYLMYALSDIQEYLRQTRIVLRDVYCMRSMLQGVLDEIPVRYFGLPSLWYIFRTTDNHNSYLQRIDWIFKNTDLRIFLGNLAAQAIYIFSLLYAFFSRNRFRVQNKELLLMTAVYAATLALHPNKFGPYLYVLMPYFSICFAIPVAGLLENRASGNRGGMFLRKASAVLLVSAFLTANPMFIYRGIFTKKIMPYGAFMSYIERCIPKGSTVAGPVYFWPAMYRDYRYISAHEMMYMIDKIMRKRGCNTILRFIPEETQREIFETALDHYKIQYFLLTTHSWEDIVEACGMSDGTGDILRRYVFDNAEKKLDLLRSEYYPGLPEAKTLKDEVWYPPSGFDNVGAEYQKSLRIYKLNRQYS